MPVANQQTPNRTARTVVILEQMIAASGLAPGEPFAVEAELEKKLGVSRAVVREAVSRLPRSRWR
jgi:DNA-binding FadR family transcriptional regulator